MIFDRFCRLRIVPRAVLHLSALPQIFRSITPLLKLRFFLACLPCGLVLASGRDLPAPCPLVCFTACILSKKQAKILVLLF